MRKILIVSLVMMLLFPSSLLAAKGPGEVSNHDFDKELSEQTLDFSITIVPGSWLPPVVDGFVLDCRSIPINFWLQETQPSSIWIKIIEANADDIDVVAAESVYEITEEDLCTGVRGKRSKVPRGNLPGEYYRFNLKGKDIPLEYGNTYALALMVGDKVLAFNEETPAILSFTVSMPGPAPRQQLKLKISQKFGQKPRYGMVDRHCPRYGLSE